MAERSEPVEEQAVRDGSAVYMVEPGIALAEEVPPGYKRTEVGVIPEDWKLRPLKEVFKFSNGINANKSAYGHGTPFINVLEPITYSHIQAKDIPGKVKVSRLVQKIYSVAYGDVVFNRTSETQDELGLAAVYVGKEAVVFGGFVIRAQPVKPVLDPIYSGYGLRAPLIRSQIVAKGQGAIRANIGQKSLRGILAPIPPSEEQRAIATALSDADALLESLDRLLAKKRASKQAAMQQLLTGQARLPGFTAEWETKRLGEIADIRSGGTPSTAIPAFWNGGVPWCTPTDITALRSRKYLSETERTISDAGLHASSAESIPPQSIIMTTRATIGECAINTVPMTTNQGFKNLVPLIVNTEFLYYLMMTKKSELIQLCSGSTFLEIGNKQLNGFELTLPRSREEEEAIATVLSDMDTEIEAMERRRNKVRQIKQAMMQQLLTGRTRLIDVMQAA